MRGVLAFSGFGSVRVSLEKTSGVGVRSRVFPVQRSQPRTRTIIIIISRGVWVEIGYTYATISRGVFLKKIYVGPLFPIRWTREVTKLCYFLFFEHRGDAGTR